MEWNEMVNSEQKSEGKIRRWEERVKKMIAKFL